MKKEIGLYCGLLLMIFTSNTNIEAGEIKKHDTYTLSSTKSVQSTAIVYGVVPKGKYWVLWSAENRSTAGQYYYIDGKPEGAIYTGQGCHPYCYKNWPNGRKLFEGESVGIQGGNGIYYQINEYPVGGVK
ncbi:MAG: hypothetical protein ACLQQ4_17885 [Bacteroidia bacterium]